jgi:hypothetical protein
VDLVFALLRFEALLAGWRHSREGQLTLGQRAFASMLGDMSSQTKLAVLEGAVARLFDDMEVGK